MTIFDDDIAECPEEFFLELRIPENAHNMGVIKGNLSNATVVINDTDDCEFYCNTLCSIECSQYLLKICIHSEPKVYIYEVATYAQQIVLLSS